MNPQVQFKSQEKGALCGFGDHESHLRQDMEVEKETQHHVNPPLLSAQIGKSILNASYKQHSAKELHGQQKELAVCVWQWSTLSTWPLGWQNHKCTKTGGSSLPLHWVRKTF